MSQDLNSQPAVVVQPLLIIVVAAIVLAALISSVMLTTRVSPLKHDLSEIIAKTALLERTLGYGGLIHNFKNALLRPAEPAYLDAVVHNADAASLLIDDLRGIAERLDVSIDLTDVEGMIAAYRGRLTEVRRLLAAGLDAQAVDARVRFNDDYALQAIGKTSTELSASVYDNLSRLFRWIALTAMVMMLATAGLVMTLIWAARSKLHMRRLDRANAALTLSNDDLQAANLSLQQFAGVAAHDLKSPINHVAFFASELREEAEDADAVRHIAGRVEDRVKRMRRMIDSLLQFSETQSINPKLSEISVADAARAAADELSPLVAASAAQIQVDADMTLAADAELLQRVFVNLLSNSIKYVPEGATPKIHITACRDGDDVVISWRDHGIGIKAEFAEMIFEPLRRLHSESDYPGVGIGLALVRSIVLGHGGDIALDKSVTDGCRFCIRLPRLPMVSAAPDFAAAS